MPSFLVFAITSFTWVGNTPSQPKQILYILAKHYRAIFNIYIFAGNFVNYPGKSFKYYINATGQKLSRLT